jgi:hypothetical protein
MITRVLRKKIVSEIQNEAYSMKKLVSGLILITLAALTASAQETPKGELFVGYSYLHLDGALSQKLGFLFPRGGSANGWNASIGGNVNRWFGLVADFSGHYGVYPLRFNRHSFLFGPKLSLRHERFTPFAQALFGAAHDQDTFNSATAFALTAGGGVDLSMSKRFAARLIQIEYARATSYGLAENNVSISAGLVLRLGKK